MVKLLANHKLLILLTLLTLISVFELSGCAIGGKIYNSENACAIFAQHNGFFDNWYKEARAASIKYRIAIPVLLATIKAESSFRPTARTRWHLALGFIPWGRISSAYGYAQAVNGTWLQYEQETGKHYSSRSSFADSVDFIGWYYRNAVNRAHINPNDAYNLYISYVVGWQAFKNYGAKAANIAIRTKAKDVALTAEHYHMQLRECIEHNW